MHPCREDGNMGLRGFAHGMNEEKDGENVVLKGVQVERRVGREEANAGKQPNRTRLHRDLLVIISSPRLLDR